MASRVVKCDWDGTVPCDIIARVAFVARVLRVRVVALRVDRTRNGYHGVMHLSRRVSATTLVALQAIFGSDWKRETFNLARVRKLSEHPQWQDRWNLLFHPARLRVTLPDILP